MLKAQALSLHKDQGLNCSSWAKTALRGLEPRLHCLGDRDLGERSGSTAVLNTLQRSYFTYMQGRLAKPMYDMAMHPAGQPSSLSAGRQHSGSRTLVWTRFPGEHHYKTPARSEYSSEGHWCSKWASNWPHSDPPLPEIAGGPCMPTIHRNKWVSCMEYKKSFLYFNKAVIF